MRYKSISGIILAGGKSKRMGVFKPFLEIGDKRMINVIIDKLKPFFGEIMIVTDNKDRFAEYKESFLLKYKGKYSVNCVQGY